MELFICQNLIKQNLTRHKSHGASLVLRQPRVCVSVSVMLNFDISSFKDQILTFINKSHSAFRFNSTSVQKNLTCQPVEGEKSSP